MYFILHYENLKLDDLFVILVIVIRLQVPLSVQFNYVFHVS